MTTKAKSVEILRPFIRDGQFPIDVTSVFYSYNEALEYAHSNPSAYAGQIISIDDKTIKQTGIYKLDYDKNEQYNFILERISIGNAGTVFNFLGSVATFEQLPDHDVLNGDMYLVEAESKFYIAAVNSAKEISWKELTLNVNIVTKAASGLMPNELFATMFNNTGKDAIYFSKKTANPADPYSNSWIEVDHVNNEYTQNYKMPSLGKVKELLSIATNKTLPSIKIYTEASIDNYINSEIFPTLTIKYYPEFFGTLKNVTIVKKVNGNFVKNVYDGLPTVINDESDKSCYFTWTESERNPESDIYNIEYIVAAVYNESENGIFPEGACSDSITFNFFDYIKYGNNNEEFNTMAKECIIKYDYDPTKFEESTHSIFIKVPKTLEVSQITYTPQNDVYALNLFTKTEFLTYNQYEYDVGNYTSFKSPGEFIFTVKVLQA